jgi:hypothetical protein
MLMLIYGGASMAFLFAIPDRQEELQLTVASRAGPVVVANLR